MRPKNVTVVFGKSLDGRDLEQQSEGKWSKERIVQALASTWRNCWVSE